MQSLHFIICVVAAATLFCTSCRKDTAMHGAPAAADSLNYVALGDSYTQGYGAPPGEDYPDLLAHDLGSQGVPLKLKLNAAWGGFTTYNVLQDEFPGYNNSSPGFATLLIGANDWVHGIDTGAFHQNLTQMIIEIQARLPVKNHLIVLTIPDISVFPALQKAFPGRDLQKEIGYYNTVIKTETSARKVPLADIFGLSQEMRNNPAMIASDSLHPSAAEYARWEKLIILPAATNILK